MEDYDRIKALLKGSDMVFITAGSGGGTGTGAAPVIARICRELGALTVAIVTKPFGFEGNQTLRAGATAASRRSAEEVDTLIVVPNNRLLSVLDKQTAMVEAFRVADDVLRQGVQGISDLVTLPGLINLDFADVRTIMSEAGNALLGIGMGMGENRATEAAVQAVSSPLLETSMEGARSILLSITGGTNLSLWEVNEAAKSVSEAAHPDANIIFGAMVDEKLDDQVWVTVVATGYGDEGRRKSLRRAARAGRRRGDASSARLPRGRARGSDELESRVHPRPSEAAPARRPRARLCYRSGMSAPHRGVVAAGHPLTAEAGARVLREGGNAVDAALAAMVDVVRDCEPLLTGLGAGGYMLVAGPGRRAGPARLLRAAPTRRVDGCGRRARRRRGLLRRRQPGLPRRARPPARSTGCRRACARRCARWGTARLEDLLEPARRSRAHGRGAERRAGLRREDPRRAC